jgi:release factor glutamine methyltransferase
MEPEIVYEPQEDSYFLLECLEKETDQRKIKKALEIGTGSGILSILLSDRIEKILAVDINPEAIKYAKAAAKKDGIKNIRFSESDLFENVKGKFDLIFFNPPYLPGKGEKCLCGGKRGQVVTERFLKEVGTYLNTGGIAIVLLSSFNQVEKLTKKYSLEKIAEKKLWFESLYCMKLSN